MSPIILWLVPALLALFLYGIGQGLVKQNISEVSPARFCLFFIVAKALVNVSLAFGLPHLPPLEEISLFGNSAGEVAVVATPSEPAPSEAAPQEPAQLTPQDEIRNNGFAVLAYLLDGAGWILYYKSIVLGPVTIIGTLSAAYPATTVVFAYFFLGETLTVWQYIGVLLVILGCVGLSYAPPDETGSRADRIWILYAGSALIIWGAAQTLAKHSMNLGVLETDMLLFNTAGGIATLGVYGFLFGRRKKNEVSAGEKSDEWRKAAPPMCMMAAGDANVILAFKYGNAAIVTPLTAAYPIVTLAYAAIVLKERISELQKLCVAMVLIGMFLSIGTSLKDIREFFIPPGTPSACINPDSDDTCARA